MNLLKETWALMQRDILLELRTKYAISGILLYVLATVVIVYTALVQLEAQVWNAIYWVIVLFAGVSAIVKSFVQEHGNRHLYYYSLVNPAALLLAKILYNTLLLAGLSLLSWLLLIWLSGNPVRETGLFVLAIFLGSLGLSVALTFVSAISAKAGNNATLMAVLGFPLVVPILMLLIKLSANALRLIQDSDYGGDIRLLLAVDVMLLGVALLLFPFLWRD